MRTFVTAALVIAALTAPALAQKQSLVPPEKERPGEEARPVVDEKKYKSATESMGNRERNPVKVDPWATVRENKPSK
jgi:hypothetical protein